MMLLVGLVVAAMLGTDGGSPFPVEIKPLVAAPSDRSQWPAWREGLTLARGKCGSAWTIAAIPINVANSPGCRLVTPAVLP